MRSSNWPEAMARFIASRRDVPFSWGGNDCVLFPADFAVAIGTADFAPEARGYDSARTARDKLNGSGFRNVKEMIIDRLDEVPLGLATRGDVALITHDAKRGIYRYTLALIDHDGSLVGPGPERMTRLPRRMASRAFRIR